MVGDFIVNVSRANNHRTDGMGASQEIAMPSTSKITYGYMSGMQHSIVRLFGKPDPSDLRVCSQHRKQTKLCR